MTSQGNGDGGYETIDFGGIDVCWSRDLEGGGKSFGQSFLPIVEHLFGKVDRIFELCAGAGCIGFSLLAHGYCDSLVLSDVNPAAVAAAEETVRRNGLEDRVTVYESDGLAGVPEDESCDLFVANPPFFDLDHVPPLRENPWIAPRTELRARDQGWRLHRALYADMARFLRPGGSVLFQETSLAVAPDVFKPMMEAGGLDHIATIWYTRNRHVPGLYFLWSKLARADMLVNPGDPAPVPIDLRDASGEGPVRVSTDRVHRLALRNRTGRPLSVVADITGDRKELLERTFVEIPPAGELSLPPTSLGPGKSIAFLDEQTRATLAELVAGQEPARRSP